MNKKPPIKIVPDKDRGMVGPDTIVLNHGEDTYHIDLLAFFEGIPMPILTTKYGIYRAEQDKAISERIAESMRKTRQ